MPVQLQKIPNANFFIFNTGPHHIHKKFSQDGYITKTFPICSIYELVSFVAGGGHLFWFLDSTYK